MIDEGHKRNHPAPTDLNMPQQWGRLPGSPTIGEVWLRLKAKAPKDLKPSSIDNMRTAYIAALYAVSAAINIEGADTWAITQEAERIEHTG